MIVRSASCALVRIALDGRCGELGERALGFARIGADRLAHLLHARDDRVADRLAAHLDLRGDGLDAADQQFLEAVDARIERVGDFQRASRRASCRSRRPLRCSVSASADRALIDRAAGFVDALLQRDRRHPCRRRRATSRSSITRAPSASLSEPMRPSSASPSRVMRSSITVAASLVRALDAGVEIIDMAAHRLGDFVGALAQPLDQFAAVDLHGAVELGQVLRDQAAERLCSRGRSCRPAPRRRA